MNEICKKEQCCGCELCKNICHKGAIYIQEDEFGIKTPIINQELCINCKLCKKVCPQLNDVKRNKVLKCYASYRKNVIKKMDSASGGVASAIYEYFLNSKKNSVVFGVEFDKKFNAVFTNTTDISYLENYKGSKYVQADINNLYKDIKSLLKKDKNVLLIGTPCQIAAINKFLEIKKISNKNLITIDLICHGVSPHKYLDEDLNYLKNKYKWDEIKKLSFRSNRKYRNFHLCIEATKNKHKKQYNKLAYEDPYFCGFLKGITLRENCYNCKYANVNRVSDITIGDFIGLGTSNKFQKFDGNPINASIIISNTKKGDNLISKLDKELFIVERSLEEALLKGTSLKKAYPKHKLRKKFMQFYTQLGFVETMNKIASEELRPKSKKEQILHPVKVYISNIIDKKVKNNEK